jgi:hypothetical protein
MSTTVVTVWLLVLWWAPNAGLQFSPPVADAASCQRLRNAIQASDGVKASAVCVEVKQVRP